VDKSWESSPQLDIIIADTHTCPVLFKTRNGTEYFPFEAVYAVGEIKSAYYSAKTPVHNFSTALKLIDQNLSREKVSSNTIGTSSGFSGAKLSDHPGSFRNPLFSFMLFVDGNNFEPEQIRNLYETTPAEHLPTFICLLNKGVCAYRSSTEKFILVPQFEALEDREIDLVFETLLQDGHSEARRWGCLFLVLMQFLSQCLLHPPDLSKYMGEMLDAETEDVEPSTIDIVTKKPLLK
jgi:hypothetical protein